MGSLPAGATFVGPPVELDEHTTRFTPTDWTRGPWDPAACHAGPPTALLARASERAVPDQPLVRLHVDLDRPVPMAGFVVTTEILRRGRTTSTVAATVTDADGRVVARARSLHVAGREVLADRHGDHHRPPARPDDAGPFPIGRLAHDHPGFRDAVEIRYPHGVPAAGETAPIWMRTIELLPGEVMSPFQRLCPVADCINAFSRHLDDQVTFLNADLTVVAHRPPEGPWIGVHARSIWEPHGVGTASAILFDQEGTVGTATQVLVLAGR